MYKFISDKIIAEFVNIPRNFLGKYAVYDVLISPVTTNSSNFQLIYTGRVYINENRFGGLYLNDIIRPYLFPLSDVRVVFNCDGDQYMVPIDHVLNIERDPNLSNVPPIDVNSNSPGMYNTLSLRCNAIPRFPKGIGNGKIRVGASVLATRGTYSDTSYDSPVFYCWNDSKGDIISISAPTSDIIVDIPYDSKLNSVSGDIYLASSPTLATSRSYVKIGEVEKCQADFYVNWIDRNGVWNCQPFSKKCVYSESIKTHTLFNLYEEERAYRKTIVPTWNLNSDWLNDDYYKLYESILVSPKIMLYDAKNDKVTEVICKMSGWEEKKQKNQRRLFNLNITLEASNKQIITY